MCGERSEFGNNVVEQPISGCCAVWKLRPTSYSSLRSLAKHDFYSLAPAFVNAHELPFNFGRKIAQHGVGSRMHVQSGCNQKEQRPFGRELVPRDISELPEFVACMVPLDARPVID